MNREQLVEMAAELAHEANRLYCLSIGDDSQERWLVAPEILKESSRQGVRNILDGKVRHAEQSHEEWLKYKTAEGWVYGTVKNIDAKTHPCLVPFEELPPAQRMKDVLYFNTVVNFVHAAHTAHCTIGLNHTF